MTTQSQEKSMTTGGGLKAGLVFLFALAFAGGAWAEGASPRKILVNFNSPQGTETSLGRWNNMSGNAGTNVALVYSAETDESTGATISWSAKGVWKAADINSVLNGYLDDNNGGSNQRITITVENVPFPFYDVVIASAADNGAGFTAKTVNEVIYTYDATSGKVVVTTNPKASWGNNSNRTTIEEGVNAITIPAVSGSTLAIASVANNVGNNAVNVPRGNIAVIEIVERLDVVADIAGEDNVWTTTSFAGTAYEGVQHHQASVSEEGASLAVAENVAAQSLSVRGGALTLTGEPVSLTAGAVVRIDSGATLTGSELVFANGGTIVNHGALTSAITVQDGELLTDRSTALSAATLTLGSTAVYNYGFADGQKLTLPNLAGSGTIKYGNTGGHGAGVALTGSTFTGTVDYTGKMGSANTDLANASRIEFSRNGTEESSLWANAAKSFDAEVYFKTDYCLGDSTASQALTFNGKFANAAGTTTTVKDNHNEGTVVHLTGALDIQGTVVVKNASKVNVTPAADTGSVNGLWKVEGNNSRLRFGGSGENGSSTKRDFTSTADILVGNGAQVSFHMGGGNTSTLKSFNGGNIYLKNGVQMRNIDGHVLFGADTHIHLGVADAFAGSGEVTYSDSASTRFTQFYQKTIDFAGTVSGAGSMTLCAPENENDAVYKLSGDNNDFAGTFVLGNNNSHYSKLVLAAPNAAKFAAVQLQARTTLALATGAATIAGLSGTAGSVALESGTAAATLTVNQATDATFGGTISGAISLIKSGNGVLELTGENTATGATEVQGGTLRVATAPAADVSVAAGAVFDLCSAPNEDGEYKLAGGAFTMADGASVCINGLPVTIGENGVFRMVTRNEDGVYLVPQGAVATFNGNSYYTIDEALAAVEAAEGSLADIEIVNAAVALPEGYALYTVTDGETSVQKLRACGTVYGIASTALFSANTTVLTAEGYETKLLHGDTLCITNNATRLKLDHQAITALVIDLPNASDIVEIGNSDGYAIAGETVTIERGVFKLTIDGGDAKVKGGRIIIADDGGLDNHGWVDFVDEEVVLESIGDHTILTNSNGNQAHIRGTTKIVKRGSGTLTIAALFDVARPVEVADGVLVLPTTTITTLSGSGKLSIPTGVTITAEGAITGQITGAGSIAIAAKDSLGSANLAADWTGSVVLPALTSGGFINLNNYGNANSTVVVTSITTSDCHINNGATSILPTVQLNGTLEIQNGYSGDGRSLSFSRITGSGDLAFTWTPTGNLPITITELVDYTGTIAASAKLATTINRLVWTGDTAEKVKVLSVSSETGKDNVTVSSIVGADGTALDVTISKEEGADGYGIYIAPKAVATVDPTAGASTVEVDSEEDAASVDLAEVVQIPEGADPDYLNYLTKSAAYDSATGKWVVTIDLDPARVDQPVITDEAGGLVDKLDDIMSTDEAVEVTVSNAIPGFYYSVETCDVLGSDVVWDEGARTLARGATVTLQVPARTRGTSGFFRICVNFVNKVAP